jgi:ABC-type nitrate/sulfonate/bicarbonate transport system permease component
MPDVAAVPPSLVAGSLLRDRRRHARLSMSMSVAIVVVGWMLVWWLAVAATGVSPDFLPSPLAVLRRAIVLTYQPVGAGALGTHVAASLTRLLSGFGLAVLIGIPLGLLMGSVRPIKWIVSPIFELFRYVPPIAWAPFAMLWFGAGNVSQAYVIFTAAFPPILMNTFRGVQLVDVRLLAAARSLGARPHVIMAEVAFPSALPIIAIGLRIGLAAGWMALIAAEIVAGSGSRDGLGYLILQGQQQLQADLTISAMLIIGLLGTVIDFAVRRLETSLIKWRD